MLPDYNRLQRFVGRDWRVVGYSIGAEYLIFDAKQATCGGLWNSHSRNCISNLSSPLVSRRNRWVGAEHRSTATYDEH